MTNKSTIIPHPIISILYKSHGIFSFGIVILSIIRKNNIDEKNNMFIVHTKMIELIEAELISGNIIDTGIM
ncbi:hypothetical protein [Photorhabdus aegyptia]|uniref:hypothetical protein n=1 Tax=Photorhabdus aegyptia TaxID=2805098 RepID=UPI00190F26C2|nr:hypothetical protein [Photorhabdus aegyptia]